MRQAQIRVFGDKRIIRAIGNKRKRAADMRPVFRWMTRDFRTIMKRQFDSQGSYLGQRWAPLAQATRDRKARMGSDRRVLHETRNMRKSFTVGTNGQRIMTRTELSFSTNIGYAKFHNSGTRYMPERVIFQFTPMIRRRWGRAMTAYLNRGVIGPPG